MPELNLEIVQQQEPASDGSSLISDAVSGASLTRKEVKKKLKDFTMYQV